MPDPDRVHSLAFQLSVGPVYFKDLPGKSRVGLKKLGLPLAVTPFSICSIGRPVAAAPPTGISGAGMRLYRWQAAVPLVGGRAASRRAYR